MINRSIVKTALIAFSLVLMFSFGAYAQKTDCSKTTDAEITEAVIAAIKVKYESQLTHISVQVKNRVVTITGWVTTKNIRKDIEKIVKKVPCVKKVVNKLTIGIGGGCPAGTKPCNGTCIPNAEECPAKGKG